MNILALNAGSSSLKLALFEVGESDERALARGLVDRLGSADARLLLHDAQGRLLVDRPFEGGDRAGAVEAALDALASAGLPNADAVGHRLVHGGPTLSAPIVVDSAVRASLAAAVRFAPLHLPAELALVDGLTASRPRLPQVVCFDTAFHRTLPEVACRLPLPRDMFDRGVRRYGFHGLSYEYVVHSVGAEALGRSVIAHLGSGASMAAVVGGRSIDTTMGLTPTGGLMMGTRTGDLDPGVLLHVIREYGYDARTLETLVDAQSGMFGVSGSSSDVRRLLEIRAIDPRAAMAIDMFCHSARKHVGALAATLGGLDSLVFTGGIGAHAAGVRAQICVGLEHLGVRLASSGDDRELESVGACRVRVVVADEERMIARHTFRALNSAPAA